MTASNDDLEKEIKKLRKLIKKLIRTVRSNK